MVNLIWSNVLNYQSFLETIFETFLVENHVSAVTRKNYRSDLKNFFSWIIESAFQFNINGNTTVEILRSILSSITAEQLENYKTQQALSHASTATINRRLSAVRMLFRYAETSGWISDNPMNGIRNVIAPSKALSQQEVVSKFEKFLTNEGASKTTVKSYVTDVNEFLNWLDQ